MCRCATGPLVPIENYPCMEHLLSLRSGLHGTLFPWGLSGPLENDSCRVWYSSHHKPSSRRGSKEAHGLLRVLRSEPRYFKPLTIGLAMTFREIVQNLPRLSIEGRGENIARNFYIPVLREAVAYDRATGYFSVDSLVLASVGVSGLLAKGGKMRLILGAHDVPEELYQAYKLGTTPGQEVVEELGRRLAAGLERVEDTLVRKRLETIAWMIARGHLELRVAMPRVFQAGPSGIFHHKTLVFRDTAGDFISADGSANETWYGYTSNGERLVVFYSWRPGEKERTDDDLRSFERIWKGEHDHYETFDLPEGIARALVRFTPSQVPRGDPWEGFPDEREIRVSRLVPAARLVRALGRLRGFTHLGLGPIRLYPHQVRAVNFAMSRFPHRLLFADEVGLGKTAEAVATTKLLLMGGEARRVLILAPRNVVPQWHEVLWKRFDLSFQRVLPGHPTQLLSPDGTRRDVSGNPFDASDLVLASWHYARGHRGATPELLDARPFDLVIIDEAHAARVTRGIDRARPTRLNELATALATLSPHVLLLSATPVQLNLEEALDLLRILGLGGPWVHEEEFAKFYAFLGKTPHTRSEEEWRHLIRMAGWFARTYLTDDLHRALETVLSTDLDEAPRIEQAIRSANDTELLALTVNSERSRELMERVVRALTPLQWFMVRNRRERLTREGYRFPDRIVKHHDVPLSTDDQALLADLDGYLRNHYDALGRSLGGQEGGTRWGLLHSVYQQRFLSSFAAAYHTVRNRRESLEALLRGDEERLRDAARRLLQQLSDEDEVEEEQFLQDMRDAVQRARVQVEAERDLLLGLEERLRAYIQPGSLRDPKLRVVLEEVSALLSRGKKVLVFSKYVDTVEQVRDGLVRDRGPEAIGQFTGDGGVVWNSDKAEWTSVSKESVQQQLRESLQVLVCSDAASEGLDLQAASAVVNVDMPWNPARVEQRIGRVDRIGQEELSVDVVNIWYPDSYEAQVYKTLFDRHELWWLVIGPASSIVADAFRRSVGGPGGNEEIRRRVHETIEQIEAAKAEASQVSQVMDESIRLLPLPAEMDVTQELAHFVRSACDALGIPVRQEPDRLVLSVPEAIPRELREAMREGLQMAPGRPSALVPGHRFVQWLAVRVEEEAGGTVPYADKALYAVGRVGGMGELCEIPTDGGPPSVITEPQEVVERLRHLLERP